MAKTIRLTERDGNRGMGVSMLPKYASSLGAGWINAAAKPRQPSPMAGVVGVDGDNGLMRTGSRATGLRAGSDIATRGVRVDAEFLKQLQAIANSPAKRVRDCGLRSAHDSGCRSDPAGF